VALLACAGDDDRAERPATAVPADTTVTTSPVTTSTAPTTTATTNPRPTTTATVPAEAEAEAPDPVRVAIPGIGVDAPVVPLGLGPGGELLPPTGVVETGWWQAGPEPGEPGAAVIAGHVDSRQGPAVFHRLRELAAGDRVEVIRADGSGVAFAVERVERHPKQAFPTDAVYGATDGPTLRLVTCGGTFDRSTGHYVDNVIVFARHVMAPR
jgi:sortase (surface protein transpeptidase)